MDEVNVSEVAMTGIEEAQCRLQSIAYTAEMFSHALSDASQSCVADGLVALAEAARDHLALTITAIRNAEVANG